MKTYIGIFLLIVFFSSCEKSILDLKPLNKISEADVWEDEFKIQAYINNLYSRFPFFAFEPSYYRMSDEGTLSVGNANAFTTGAINRSGGEPTPYWDYAYIRDCNIFLEKIPNTTIRRSLANDMEGQVRFMRAYAYFEMQKRYGGVPLVDVVVDPFKEIDKKYTTRSTEEQIADFIYDELNKAISLLSEDPSMKGKINKWTAYSFQARAALWSACISKYSKVDLNGLVGIPASRADEFFEKAISAANAVIISNNYSLYNEFPDDKAENFRNIFVDKSNVEIIFNKEFDGIKVLHDYWTSYQVLQTPTLSFLLQYENIDGSDDQPLFGTNYLYDDGYAPFIKKDPRLLTLTYFQGETWKGQPFESYWGLDPNKTPDPSSILSSTQTLYEGVRTRGLNASGGRGIGGTGFIIKKFWTDEIIPTTKGYPNWIVFRLADIYLMKAEAEFELGNMQNAAEALNQTRTRAGISLIDENSITLERIRNERRSELAFESQRFWDLIRWRVAENVLTGVFSTGLEIIYHYHSGKFYFLPVPNVEEFSRTFKPNQYYMPITDGRINNNPDLIENPLY